MTEPRSAAIFDLDGTLIPTTSAEWIFFGHMLRTGTLSVLDLIKMLGALWSAHGNIHDMLRENKRYLRSKHVDDLERIAHNYFEPQIDKMVFPIMRNIVEEHRHQGDLLLMLSGTLDVIARSFVRLLRFDGYRASTLEANHGRYTGRITGIMPYGMGKLEVLRGLHKEFSFNWNKTTLYANVYADRYVMNAVAEPVAVNPDRRLLSYAVSHGWRTIEITKPVIKNHHSAIIT